jgi:hypothetical protein
MALDLGLAENLKRDDFSRTYYPNALAEKDYVEGLERAARKRAMETALSPQANVAPQMTATTETKK